MTSSTDIPNSFHYTQYVTVMQIPVIGGSGKPQNRVVAFAKSPTKEQALAVIDRLNRDNSTKDNYSKEWERCRETLEQIPEDLFKQMHLSRTNKMTFLVVLEADGFKLERIFSARSCPIQELY